MNWPNKAILAALCVIAIGCTTVKPVHTEARHPSFDSGNQDSGFLGWTNGCGIITPHARDRYNALIAVYGKRFSPPLSHDQGIYFKATPDGNYLICQSAIVNFETMNRWHKESFKP